MKYQKRRISTAALLCNLALAIIILAVITAFTSCTVRMDGDGAKSFSVDGAAFVETLQIISEK